MRLTRQLRIRIRSWAAVLLVVNLPALVQADEPDPAQPRPVAATRAQLKLQLENSKRSTPRLPLPPPTEAEAAEAKSKANSAGRGAIGGIVNNGRMRKLYLPAAFTSGGFSREPDPALTLSQTFKTEFFWIVSRANNCTYCSGHQEVKLAADGVPEETIAALDGDWSEFTPAEQAAFAFALKVTNEPHAITSADIAKVKAYYNELQVLEILNAVAGFNAMNRWTGPLAIPQEDHRVYLTPTPEKFRDLRSRVAPLTPNAVAPTCARAADRGPRLSRAEIEAACASARERTPRLPLVDESKVRAVSPADWALATPPQWVRLLSNFPKSGPPRIAMHRATERLGKLAPKLRAEIAWVCAREDRAFYALSQARHRLRDLGLSDDAIFALDDSKPAIATPDREALALALARKITVNPALVTDQDIATLRKSFSDHEVAEIVFQSTEAAWFDRLTETAGLRAER